MKIAQHKHIKLEKVGIVCHSLRKMAAKFLLICFAFVFILNVSVKTILLFNVIKVRHT